MKGDLEVYLSALDEALAGRLPISTKAEIITEIKSHVQDRLDEETDVSIDTAIADLGSAESVANRYLTERGLGPVVPKKTSSTGASIAKWISMSLLGTAVVGGLAVGLLVWKFTPFMVVTEGRVDFFGGAVSVQDVNRGTSNKPAKKARAKREKRFDAQKTQGFSTGKNAPQTESRNVLQAGVDLSGSRSIDPAQIQALSIDLKEGKVLVVGSKTDVLSWKCDGTGGRKTLSLSHKDHKLRLNMGRTAATCQVSVPAGMHIYVSGQQGEVVTQNLSNSANIRLTQGIVRHTPDPLERYAYDLQVRQGTVDPFQSDRSETAHKISVRVKEGEIRRGTLKG